MTTAAPTLPQVARDLPLQRQVRAAAEAMGEVDGQRPRSPNPAQAMASANRAVRSGSLSGKALHVRVIAGYRRDIIALAVPRRRAFSAPKLAPPA
jgi:hypothetical protein